MPNKPSINLDRINEGDSLIVTKSYDGTGKLCSNGSTMFGVVHDGIQKSFFVHEDDDTEKVIECLNKMAVNTSVAIKSNNGGGYTINGRIVEKQNNKNTNSPNWDAIAEGKVRHGFAIEAYKMGKGLNSATMDSIDEWVQFVMNGQDKTKFPFDED